MKKLNRNRSLWAGTLMVGLAVTSSGVIQAQPDGEAPRGRQGGQGGRGGGRGGFGNMTPEQREQQMQQRREEGLRRSLGDAGFIAKDLQDAVVAFAVAQDKERNASQEKVRELAAAVREGTDEEVATLLAAVRADAAAAKTRRETALNELDAKIGFRRNARLEAILVLAGLTGEEIASFGGRGGFGGPGGPGGPGGGRGGRGGRGGGQGGPGGPGGPGGGQE